MSPERGVVGGKRIAARALKNVADNQGEIGRQLMQSAVA